MEQDHRAPPARRLGGESEFTKKLVLVSFLVCMLGHVAMKEATDTDSDIHCSVDILDDEDENKVEIAKKDLTLIFNKINKSLSDLDKLDLGSGDSENHASKSKKNLKEKSEVSFKVNIEENSQAFVASAHPENRIKHKQLRNFKHLINFYKVE